MVHGAAGLCREGQMWPRVPGHFSPRQAKFWKGRGRHRRPAWAGKVLGQLERCKVGHSPVTGRPTSLTWAAKHLKRCWDGRQRRGSPARGEVAATRAIGGLRVRRKVAVDEVCANPNCGSPVLNANVTRRGSPLGHGRRRILSRWVRHFIFSLGIHSELPWVASATPLLLPPGSLERARKEGPSICEAPARN